MTINMNAVCRKDKLNRNNTAPIHIRFTHLRKIRYVSTGLNIRLDSWDFDNQKLVPNFDDCKDYQRKIDSCLAEYEKKAKRLEALDIEITFETLLESKTILGRKSVDEYFTQTIAYLKKSGKINTATKYRFCLVSLCKFRSMDIRFEEITVDFLRDYEVFMRQNGIMENSMATRFSVLKAVYNKALADKVFICKDNPFVNYKVGALWKSTRKRSITKEEVRRLMELELPATLSPYLSFARDMFLFSYLTAGINFKDIAMLRHSNIIDGRVYYSRRKTSKSMNCKLNSEALNIIAKYARDQSGDGYLFPILDKGIHVTEQQIFDRVHKVLCKVNKNLRTLGKLAGITTPLTTYVARHTYATVLKRSGVNIAIISESLGHSDLSTTQIYLDSFENSQIDEAMSNLL